MASRINRLSMALLFSPLKVLLNASLISFGTLKFTVAIAFTIVEIFNNRVTHSEVGKSHYSWQGDHVETSLLKELDSEGTDDTYADWRKSASSTRPFRLIKEAKGRRLNNTLNRLMNLRAHQ
jgi:hypothetical protein